MAVRSQAAPQEASGHQLGLPEYIAELDRASAVLAGNDPTAIHDYRETLPREWLIQADGERRIDTGWLATALAIEERSPGADDVVVQQAKQRLASLRDAAEELAKPASGRAIGSAEDQLGEILRGREFQRASGPSQFELLKARIYAWIFRQIERLLGSVGRVPASGDTILWVIISLAALLLGYWAVHSLSGSTFRPKMDLSGASPRGRDWYQWAREARAAAERGDYRAAIHGAYWAAVSRLEDTGNLPEGRSRTPRESLRLIGRESAAYEPFAHMTRGFELIWYGYRTATFADWTDTIRRLESLECQHPSIPVTAGY